MSDVEHNHKITEPTPTPPVVTKEMGRAGQIRAYYACGWHWGDCYAAPMTADAFAEIPLADRAEVGEYELTEEGIPSTT